MVDEISKGKPNSFPASSPTRPQQRESGSSRRASWNEVVGKQNWLHLFNKYSYYYNEINILNAMFFFSQPIRIAFVERSLHVCLRSEWVSAVFVHYTIYCQSSFHFSLQKTVLTGEKMNEKLCTNWSEKTFDNSFGMKYATRKQINNRCAQHSSMAQKEGKKVYFIVRNYEKGKAIL